VSILLERGSLVVRSGCLQIGQASHSLSNVQDVDVRERYEGGSLIWAIYGGLSVLALVQAVTSNEPTLAVLGAALAVFANVTWKRRNGCCTYELVLAKNGEAVRVHQTRCRTEAWLMRDAIAMAMPR
jgi:hypothetical protein